MKKLKFRVWNKTENKYVKHQYVGSEMYVDIDGVFDVEQDGYSSFVWEQFTGLFDRNGKEIFEGDILNLQDFLKELGFINGLVEYESGCMGCRISYDLQLIPFIDMQIEELQNLEIIGNVNENPELLK
jgi:uncharacterized phage protein (TIGR01671 family)